MAAPVIASAAGSAAGVAGNLAAGAVNIAGQGIGAAGGYVGNQLAQTFSNIAGADNKSADIGTQTPNIIVLPSAQSAPTASQMQSLDTPKTLTSTAQKTNKSSDFWFILGTVGVVAFNIFKRII
jgi:phage tail tape-measure protein